MITTDGLRKLGNHCGVQDDITIEMHEPGENTDWAHEIRLVRGCMYAAKRFMAEPTLGEMARALEKLLRDNAWLQ